MLIKVFVSFIIIVDLSILLGTATAKEWDVNLKSVYKQWHRVRELMSKDIRSCPVQFSASLDIANYEVDEAYIEHIWVDADQPYLNQLVLGIKVCIDLLRSFYLMCSTVRLADCLSAE